MELTFRFYLMIISDKFKFAFIHIPKCAGTYSKRKLISLDDLQGEHTDKIGYHPTLGKIDFVHIPLFVLEKYFPPIYKKILEYETFAITRDPFTRFPSSVSEYVKKYTEHSMLSLSNRQLCSIIDELIKILQNYPKSSYLPYKLIHFQNQRSFLFNRNERIIDNIYNENNFDAMYLRLSHITGCELSNEKPKNENRNFSYVFKSELLRKSVILIRPYISAPAHKILPNKFFRMFDNMVLTSTHKGKASIFKSEYIREFVSDYYSDDINFYNDNFTNT